jgi:hypothetical protein
MFGLNKNKKDKSSKPFFKFPLETDLEDEDKLKVMMENAEAQILALKKTIKDGASPEEYEKIGTLLHAYSALLKILNRVPEQK